MMVPEFIRFYGYTAADAMSEFAKTFFSLVNYMYRLKATELLDTMTVTSAAFAGGKDASSVVSELNKQSQGIQGIVKEVRNIKG